MTNQTILVTGGTGFIGSHTVVELLQKNYSVIILDNLYNSSKKVLERIREVAFGYVNRKCRFCFLWVVPWWNFFVFVRKTPEKEVEKRLIFYEVNLLDRESLEKIFEIHKNEISSVIHFAGLKVLGSFVICHDISCVLCPLCWYFIHTQTNRLLENQWRNLSNIITTTSPYYSFFIYFWLLICYLMKEIEL
jgi:hypothetical protein